MIIFPIANSIKMRETTGLGVNGMPTFRNTLYQYLSAGVNQVFENTGSVNRLIFCDNRTITIQALLDSSSDPNDYSISINNEDGSVNFGTIEAPTTGATSLMVLDNGEYEFWNINIPTSSISGECYISIYDPINDEDYTSETFCISSESYDSDLGNNVLILKYKNDNGFEKDYYWTDGDYQSMTIQCAYYSGLEFDTEKEQAEGVSRSELLYSNTRGKVTRTILGVPEYLYEKIIKASYSTDLYVNNKAMVCDDISQEFDQDNGLTNLICTYKEKNTKNTY